MYVVYDTVSEFVFSLVDITLGLLVMFVVTRTRRKGTKDVNLYSKMKNRSIRFIAAWIAVSVLAMILMIISLSLKPGDGTSLVDMPGIFHDLSRVCINIEFIFSIQFMLMMKEWILYSTGSEDPQSEGNN